MGVSGLLPLLKPICSKVHVEQFRGKKVGVDGYGWLHRGAHGCAVQLCTKTPTTGYVTYFKRRLSMLLYYGIEPVVVFDGDRLPMKGAEESERQRRRKHYEELGHIALAESRRGDAEEAFRKAIDVTPLMAFEVMKVCRELGVEFMVAPYEADAQLAYLSMNGKVEAVISEDSDLFVFGVTRLLLKLDNGGDAELLDAVKLPAMRDPDFTYFSRDMVVYMCVLAGCDFFPGIKGVGVRTAHALVRRYKSFDRLVQLFRYSLKYKEVPTNFEEEFRRACLVYSHQRVYDPDTRRTVHLRDPEGGLCEASAVWDASFLGPPLDDETARAIAEGVVDPLSRKKYETNAVPVSRGAQSIATMASARGRGARRTSRSVPAGRGRTLRAAKMDEFVRNVSGGSPGGKALGAPFRPPRGIAKTSKTRKGTLMDYFRGSTDAERSAQPNEQGAASTGISSQPSVEMVTQSQQDEVFKSPVISDQWDRIRLPTSGTSSSSVALARPGAENSRKLPIATDCGSASCNVTAVQYIESLKMRGRSLGAAGVVSRGDELPLLDAAAGSPANGGPCPSVADSLGSEVE